jgi:hypothetical protein
MTVSTDGFVMWWDIRKMSESLESLPLRWGRGGAAAGAGGRAGGQGSRGALQQQPACVC